MKNKNFIQALALITVTCTIITLSPIQVNAAWIKDNKGWWYTEGHSWAAGWRFINSKWYYFGQNGYMTTGWLNDNGKWYFLSNNGDMLFNTITPDGYLLNMDGSWDGKAKNTISNKKILETSQQVYPLGTTSIDLSIYNNTNKVLLYGNYFEIAKLENNQWVELPSGKNAFFTDLADSLESGEYSNEKCNLTWLKDFDNLTPGKYRVAKEINKEIVYAEFELK